MVMVVCYVSLNREGDYFYGIFMTMNFPTQKMHAKIL